VNPDPSAHDWRALLEAAERENDPQRLQALMTLAEDAIFLRLQKLEGRPDEELERGIATLRELQVTKLDYPRLDSEAPQKPGLSIGYRREDKT
jgi:hypothetical protein